MTTPIPFGKYRLLDRVDVGGMAEVFRAIAPGAIGFERYVAIKRILPQVAAQERFTRMFIDEAKIAGQLSHPNIAQIFDLGIAEGSYFIAMEFVHGKDLKTMFSRLQSRNLFMPVEAVCYVFLQLLDGLAYAHDKRDPLGRPFNLVHQDVSPQNILVSFDGETKLIDFGLAEATGFANQTEDGIVKGKFAYLSPEQVDGKTIDQRTDLFSAGICLYELLTCRRLFRADSEVGTVQSVARCEVTSPSQHNPGVPEALDRFVHRLLARDRDARYQSALEAYDDLLRVMDGQGYAFGRKQLADYMCQLFRDELDAAQRDGHGISPGVIQTAASLSAGVSGEWEDEVPTRLYSPLGELEMMSNSPSVAPGGDAIAESQTGHAVAAMRLGWPAETLARVDGRERGVPEWWTAGRAVRRQPLALVVVAVLALTTLLIGARALFAQGAVMPAQAIDRAAASATNGPSPRVSHAMRR